MDVDVVVAAVTEIIDSCVTKGRRNSEQNDVASNLMSSGLFTSRQSDSAAKWAV